MTGSPTLSIEGEQKGKLRSSRNPVEHCRRPEAGARKSWPPLQREPAGELGSPRGATPPSYHCSPTIATNRRVNTHCTNGKADPAVGENRLLGGTGSGGKQWAAWKTAIPLRCAPSSVRIPQYR